LEWIKTIWGGERGTSSSNFTQSAKSAEQPAAEPNSKKKRKDYTAEKKGSLQSTGGEAKPKPSSVWREIKSDKKTGEMVCRVEATSRTTRRRKKGWSRPEVCHKKPGGENCSSIVKAKTLRLQGQRGSGVTGMREKRVGLTESHQMEEGRGRAATNQTYPTGRKDTEGSSTRSEAKTSASPAI